MRRRPSVPLPPARSAAVVAVLALLASLGCDGGAGEAPGIRCAALEPPAGSSTRPTAADTVEVVVALEDRHDPVELLVRVDPLDGPGIVAFREEPPPAAAAAGLTVTPAAVFTVCLSGAPAALVFEASATPRDKAWLRVSTDRPVRAVVRVGGDGGVTLEPAVAVAPGRSARRRWTVSRGGS